MRVPPPERLSFAAAQGMAARVLGRTRSDCPYHHPDPLRIVWKWGFDLRERRKRDETVSRETRRETRLARISRRPGNAAPEEKKGPGRGHSIYGRRTEWTESELALLLPLAEAFGVAAVAEMLNRSNAAVRGQLCRLRKLRAKEAA